MIFQYLGHQVKLNINYCRTLYLDPFSTMTNMHLCFLNQNTNIFLLNVLLFTRSHNANKTVNFPGINVYSRGQFEWKNPSGKLANFVNHQPCITPQTRLHHNQNSLLEEFIPLQSRFYQFIIPD